MNQFAIERLLTKVGHRPRLCANGELALAALAETPFDLVLMYPLLAKQIVDDFGITKGVCLDVGTGSAAVIIELAKITDLDMAFNLKKAVLRVAC